MKTKFNLKLLLLVSILLIAMCLFNTNMVQATDVTADETTTTTGKTQETTQSTTDTKTTTTEQTTTAKAITDPQEIIALIPNTINLDILESQIFSSNDDSTLKSDTLVNEQINTVLKNNNIDLANLGIRYENTLSGDTSYEGIINKCQIILRDNNYKELAKKEITIKYKNSDNYNTTDKEYVENKLKNIKFDVLLTSEIGKDNDIDYDTLIIENAKKVTNDTSLTFFTKGVAGCGSDVVVLGYNLFVYKNDILYAVKPLSNITVYMITIPDNIQDTDEAYINYALPKIKEFWNNYTVKGVTRITGTIKQSEDDIIGNDITNDGTWYKISLSDNDWARVVLKKATATKVIDHVAISNNSGVTINGANIDTNNSIYTEMLNRAKAKGYSNVFGAYELKLSSGSIKDGLTITFSLGTENNGKQAIVLHKKTDGSYEEFTKTVKDGKIDVTVSELSPFMIALKGDRKLDNEPKAGVADYTVFASIIALISLGGLVTLKFKK